MNFEVDFISPSCLTASRTWKCVWPAGRCGSARRLSLRATRQFEHSALPLTAALPQALRAQLQSGVAAMYGYSASERLGLAVGHCIAWGRAVLGTKTPALVTPNEGKWTHALARSLAQ